MKKINIISSWAQGIIVAVIIGTIIEIILPNEKNKKYIKTIIGIYILFVIVYPVINKISSKSINLNNIVGNTYKSDYKQMNTIKFDVNNYVDETYKNKLKEEIKEEIDKNGYVTNSISIEINSEEANYGEILGINLRIDKEVVDIKNSNVEKIETVEINFSNNDKQIKENINEEDKNKVQDIISKKYLIEKSKIKVND